MKKLHDMNILIGLAAFLILFAAPPVQAADQTMKQTIKFLSAKQGRKLLTTEDAYTAKWSPFDIQSRMQSKDASREQLMTMIGKQAMSWSAEEQIKVMEMIEKIDRIIEEKGFDLPLPKKIPLIKSSTAEEGGADGYTRENYIVLRQDLIFRDDSQLEQILLHELFHVLSRNDSTFRAEMYAAIGFTVDEPMEYPDELKPLRITNPDAHANDSYVTLTKPDNTQSEFVMMLFSAKPYDGGSFFPYIKIGFLETEGTGAERKAVYKNDRPAIYSIDKVTDFFQIVGQNTQYIIDPEEILADNFSYAFSDRTDYPSQHIIDEIRRILKE